MNVPGSWRSTPWPTLSSARVAFGVGVVIALAMVPSRLFGITGAESALVLGVLLPPFVAAAVVRRVLALTGKEETSSPAALFAEAAGFAAFIVSVPTVLLAANGLRLPNCAPLEGLAFIALGPGFGTLLAATLAVPLAFAFPKRPGLATTLAVLAPVLGLFAGLVDLYATPAVFAFNHFAGYYPGTLYDELVGITITYVTFRLVTVLLIAAIVIGTLSSWNETERRLTLRRAWQHPAAWLVALACAFGAATLSSHAAELGHRASVPYIIDELGSTLQGKRCIVHAPRELPLPARERLVADCDFRVTQMERVLGLRHPRRLRAFFFRSEDEKKRLMGAGSTFIAKPWRNEVYLQISGFPHPVLAHEISHVIAGNAASGPFHIAASFGGWWPNPGLIEGLAVASSWELRDGMTPHEWARAMLDLRLMPKLDDIFSFNFLKSPSSRAYTAAGSFLRFILDTRGKKVLIDAYRQGNVARATGQPLAELEREWHAFLRTVELDASAKGLARMRFERASIFSAICPHQIAALEEDLADDFAARDTKGAVDTCRQILAIDPGNTRAHAAYAGTLARAGDLIGARQELSSLEGKPPAPTPLRQSTRETLADELWRGGHPADATKIYTELLAQPLSDDAARPLEVKLDALHAGGEIADIVFDILVGRAGPTPPQVVVERALRLSAVRPDGLGPYLAARQVLGSNRADLALPLLEDALRRGLPSERLTYEAKRIEALALFYLGRYADASARFRALPTKTAGQRAEVDDWLERCQFAQRP